MPPIRIVAQKLTTDGPEIWNSGQDFSKKTATRRKARYRGFYWGNGADFAIPAIDSRLGDRLLLPCARLRRLPEDDGIPGSPRPISAPATNVPVGPSCHEPCVKLPDAA